MNDMVSRNELGELVIKNHVLKSFDIVPNSIVDMQEMIESDKVKVRLFDIQSSTLAKDDRLKLGMVNSIKNDAFLVVFGGWIPCAFIKRKTILIVDRNIVTEITSRYKGGKKKSNKDLDYFDSIFLQNRSVSIDISAFVIEANERKIPSNDIIDQQISNVKKSLKAALPNLKICAYPDGNSYYHNLKDLLTPRMKKRMEFLKSIVPQINRQFTKKSREEAVNIVFDEAKKMELSKGDIVIILALLRITMTGKKTAAQLVLKDSQSYSAHDAYNAACDLSAIELLINLHNFHIKEKSGYNVAFITKDKGLSLFSSLFSEAKVNGTSQDNLQVSSKIFSTVFGDDECLLVIYEKWLNGKY